MHAHSTLKLELEAQSADRSAEDPWRLFVAGDCYFRRDASPTADSILAPDLRERIAETDLAIANFEAPIRTTDATAREKSGPVLENDPASPAALSESGFDAVTLANNHVGDYGDDGVLATLDACRDAGLETIGAGPDHDTALEPLSLTIGETTVSVVNVAEREFNVADEDRAGCAWLSHRDVRETIETARTSSDVLIVIAHGGVEYVPFPPPAFQERLREFVDLGADLVVGHHPHVPQGWERYAGSQIFYSLGNFVFDSMADSANTSWGLALDVTFVGATPHTVEVVPVALCDGVVHPLDTGRDPGPYLEYLHRISEITADASLLEPFWQEVAVQVFHGRYSNWLLRGCGGFIDRARSNPHDPSAQRSLWDVETRRTELLTLLTIIRTESHRWLLTTALAVLSGESADERTPEIREEAQALLGRTERT